MEEQNQAQGAQLDALTLLRYVARYIYRRRWLHVAFMVVAVALAVLVVKIRPLYESSFALVISDTWLSPDEMQYVLANYARARDTAVNVSECRRSTYEISLKDDGQAGFVERQTPQGLKLVFDVECLFTKVLDRELFKRDVIRYINEHPYVIRVRKEKEQEILEEMRSLDSLSFSMRKTFKELFAEGMNQRFLVDVNSLAEPDKLFINSTDLRIKLSRLAKFCDIVSVGKFKSLGIKRAAKYAAIMFLLLTFAFAGFVGYRELLREDK